MGFFSTLPVFELTSIAKDLEARASEINSRERSMKMQMSIES